MLSSLIQGAGRAAKAAQEAAQEVAQEAAQLVFGWDEPAAESADATSGADSVRVERAAPADASALLARLRAMGLRNVDALLLTTKRRTMVSIKGRMLRVHVGYLGAGDDVLTAIVAFVMARRGAGRTAAMHVIIGYARGLTEHSAPARVARTHPADEALAERLEIAHAEMNEARFGGELQGIPVRVSRRMKSRLGHYSPARGGEGAEIAISQQHLKKHGWASAMETLLHEMVHQWQAETGRPLDHGTQFRKKAREVGIRPRATRAVD